MRAMASESSGLAALDCTTVSSPRFLFQTAPTCPPVAESLLFGATPAEPLLREIHHHGQRPAAPVLQTSRTALVFLDKQPPRQLVLFRVSGLAGQPGETFVCNTDPYLRVSAEVLHPIRAVASSREHVEGTSLRHEGEPDLDLVRPPRYPTRRGQVAEVLFCKATKITHRHQVCTEGSASRNPFLTPVAFIPLAVRRDGSCRSSSWVGRR